jgi:hypothetical protein
MVTHAVATRLPIEKNLQNMQEVSMSHGSCEPVGLEVVKIYDNKMAGLELTKAACPNKPQNTAVSSGAHGLQESPVLSNSGDGHAQEGDAPRHNEH